MPDRYAVIEFEEDPGTEHRVRLSPVPMSTFEAVTEAFVNVVQSMLPENTRALGAAFAPVYDGDVAALDVNVFLALVREWLREVRTAPLPLRLRSSDGEPSEDPEVASPSP
jgi:hypothetical protein